MGIRFYKMLTIAVLICAATTPVSSAIEVLGGEYRPDTPFPEYARFWSDRAGAELGVDEKAVEKAAAGFALGGSIHVFLRNTDQQAVTITDVKLAGVSLKRAIAFSDQRKFKRVAKAASIYFSDLTQEERDRLISTGEPVWWRVDPQVLSPLATAEVLIRMRRQPKDLTLPIEITTDAGAIKTPVSLEGIQPRVESISFSPALDQVYLYLRQPEHGRTPKKIQMDGVNITADCTIAYDPAVEVTPVVCRLTAPLPKASFHCFQATYNDGTSATAGLRAWADEITYGIWGAKPGKDDELEIGRAYIQEIGQHNINAQM